jgi:hypothetical protein
MRLLTRIAAIGGLVALGVGGPAVASAGASTPPGLVGHVYVNDNSAGANTIAAFDRHAAQQAYHPGQAGRLARAVTALTDAEPLAAALAHTVNWPGRNCAVVSFGG